MKYVLLIFTLIQSSRSEKSCESRCSDQAFPRCGAWVQSDNNRLSTGIYLLDQGFANLTCVITSLPRPTRINWYFEPEFTGVSGSDRLSAMCSSLRTTSECKYNEFGEHRVTSTCLLKINKLEQSGSYFCSGQLEEYDDAESSKIRILAYGISSISLYESSAVTVTRENGTVDYERQIHTEISLEYGKIGHLKLRICAYPKPHLVWIHRSTGRTVSAGSSSENETASLLYHDLDTRSDGGGPVLQFHYCYIAALIVGRVQSNSHAWTVMVWNSVDSKRYDIPIVIRGIPVPKTASKFNAKFVIIVIFTMLSMM